jgi:hypothetical protein
VNGSDILDDVRRAVTDYCVLPSRQAADAIVLWIAVSHALSAFDYAPRLVIKSVEKRSGKSRLLEVIDGLAYKPQRLVNASIAYLFRRIESSGEHPPTLLLDEADTLFGNVRQADNNEDLRGLLNSGFQRGTSYGRVQGPSLECKEYRTFALAAVAGIGDMPETIEDRAIIVRIKRRRPAEIVKQFRLRDDGDRLAVLSDRLTAWLEPELEALASARPDMPVEDRAADVWEPLVAVANLAGGEWPNKAWDAALQLTEEYFGASQQSSISGQLLGDIKTISLQLGEPRALTTASLLAELHKLEESPWATAGGNGLDARTLAKRLAPYGVRPVSVRTAAGEVQRGYRHSDLWDAWERYLDAPVTSATSATPQGIDVAAISVVADAAATRSRPALGQSVEAADVAPVAPGRKKAMIHG